MNSRATLLSRGPTLDAWLFYVGRFVRDGARMLMAVLAVIYLAEIGFSNAQVGIIFGFSLAGGFAVSLAVMLTSRAIPTRIWSIANMLILAAAGVVLIISNDFWFLVLGGFFGAYAASGAHWGGMMQLEQTGNSGYNPAGEAHESLLQPQHRLIRRARRGCTTRRPIHTSNQNLRMGAIGRLSSRFVAIRWYASARRNRLHPSL